MKYSGGVDVLAPSDSRFTMEVATACNSWHVGARWCRMAGSYWWYRRPLQAFQHARPIMLVPMPFAAPAPYHQNFGCPEWNMHFLTGVSTTTPQGLRLPVSRCIYRIRVATGGA